MCSWRPELEALLSATAEMQRQMWRFDEGWTQKTGGCRFHSSWIMVPWEKKHLTSRSPRLVNIQGAYHMPSMVLDFEGKDTNI